MENFLQHGLKSVKSEWILNVIKLREEAIYYCYISILCYTDTSFSRVLSIAKGEKMSEKFQEQSDVGVEPAFRNVCQDF
jgi:hypothetical protein